MFGILKCRVEIVQESFFVVADVVQVQVQVERLLCLTTAVALETFYSVLRNQLPVWRGAPGRANFAKF